jgi:integrase
MLYKRGDVWHYDFTVKGERYRGSTGFKKKADATEFEDQQRRSIKLGTSSSRAVATLGQAADQYFASRASHLKSATTVAQRIKIMLRHLGRDTPVNQIGPREIEAAIIARRVEPTRQGKLPTAGTVNRDLIDTTLRPILGYAGEIMEEPVRKIKWAKLRMQEPQGRTRSFGAEELAAWREALPEWHRPIFDFVARYGLRLGEVFFPPSAVDVAAAEIRLADTKNGRDHTIPLLPEDVPAMASRKARAQLAKLDTVWFRDEGGELTPIHWRAFQSASRAALAAAGIADAKPAHDLRHHAATALLRSTGNLKLVQDLLNHQSVTSSARYAHTSKGDLREGLRHAHATKDGASRETLVESKTGDVT